MSKTRDWSADATIDAVARRMVAVDDDAELASRIAAALPERRRRLVWLVPQLSAGAAIAIAVAVWFTRAAPAPPEAVVAMVPLRAPVEAIEPLRAVEPERAAGPTEPSGSFKPLEPLEPLNPMDHERALPAAEAPAVLAFGDLAPRDLPAVEALTVASLEIGDLPLTGESFPPREF